MVSPICKVNGSVPAVTGTSGFNVTGGSTVTILLNDSTGVNKWTISCTNTDDLTSATTVNASLVVTGFSATFTAPSVVGARGAAVQFTSTVNNGVDSNGKVQPSYTTTFGIFVLGSSGYRIFFSNETNESNSTYGCVSDVNVISTAPTPGTTGSTAGTIVLTQDLGGTYLLPNVVGLYGNAIKNQGTLGAGQDGFVLTWKNSDSQWEALAVSDTDTLSGDVTGSLAATVVSAISGSTPIAITPATLQWISGTATPTITQAVVAGTGATNGTNLRFIAQAGQQQSGTNANNNGGYLYLGTGAAGTGGSGAAGTPGIMHLQLGGSDYFVMQTTSIALTPPNIQFASTATTISINQAVTSAGSGTSFTIQAQAATGGSNNGGQLILAGGTSGSATAGTVVIQTGGSTRLTVGATGVVTIANLGTGVVHADSSGNLTSSNVVNTDIDSAAAIAVSKLAAGTSAQVLLNSGTPTPTWTTISGDVAITNTGATTVKSLTGNSGTVNIGSTGNIITWAAATTAPGLAQSSTSSGSGATMTIVAQGATGVSNNGGILTLSSGSSGSATGGSVQLQTAGTNQITISPTTITLGTGAGNTSTVFDVAGTTNLTLTSATLQWNSTISSPALNQANASSASGQTFAITAQAGNGSGNNGGVLALAGGASGGGAGLVGNVQVNTPLQLKTNVFNDATSSAVQTTNATLTTIYTDISIPASTVFDFMVTVVGINTSTQDVYRADFAFTYSRVGSAAPGAVGATATALNVRTSLAANTWGGASIALSTNAVIVQVTGKTSTTIDWNCSFSRIQVV